MKIIRVIKKNDGKVQKKKDSIESDLAKFNNELSSIRHKINDLANGSSGLIADLQDAKKLKTAGFLLTAKKSLFSIVKEMENIDNRLTSAIE